MCAFTKIAATSHHHTLQPPPPPLTVPLTDYPHARNISITLSKRKPYHFIEDL